MNNSDSGNDPIVRDTLVKPNAHDWSSNYNIVSSAASGIRNEHANEIAVVEDKNSNQAKDLLVGDTEVGVTPNDAELWNRKGVGLARAGHYTEAYACFENALILNPNHQEAWLNKGKVILKLKDKERDALLCFSRAAEIDPNKPEVWFVKGVALARLDMMQDALNAYEHATELEPRHAGAWYGMGLAALNLGYKKRAEECFRKSKKLGKT